MEPNVEIISADEKMLGYIIKKSLLPLKTKFITTPEHPFQLGYIVYPTGGVIPKHYHKPVKREIHNSSEALIVLKGECAIDFYDQQLKLVASRELIEGDIVLILSGGHGFRMHADTVLLEIKQGPFIEQEKGFF